jgi:hypothetical protein
MKPKIGRSAPAGEPQTAWNLPLRRKSGRDSMRRRAFMGLVASYVAFLPVAASAVTADELRVTDPVVHENLAVYFVHGQAAGGHVPVSLEEALAGERVRVRETGSVNELTIENVGDKEVFVQSGDIVKGGRQDRVLSVDLLLPPHSGQVSIAAFCVESGRWSARGQEDSRQFSAAAAAMPSHEARLAMRAYMPSAAAPIGPVVGQLIENPAADVHARQSEIWATVKTTQDRLARAVGAQVAAPASPSSLQLSLENEKLKIAQAAYMKTMQGSPLGTDVVGYVAAINGKIVGGDVYAAPDLFRKMWPKLLAASVTEAISTNDAAAASPPSADQVAAFLKAAVSGPETEHVMNASVRVATRDSDATLYAETRRADGVWVHRNYLVK